MKRTKSKIDSCFTPHVMMHGLFGLGLGLFLASLIPDLGNWLIGLVVMIIAIALDATRKN